MRNNTVDRLRRYSRVLFKCMQYNLASALNLNAYPEFLVFYTTFRCNSRCKACNIWKGDDKAKMEKELSLEQIGEIFSDPLFKKLSAINVQGGEPTLREDLVELVRTIIRKTPSLKTVALTSNGLNPDLAESNVRRLYALCREHDLCFSICLSIDGVGAYHDFARGKGAFGKVTETIEKLSALRKMPGFYLGTNCVLTARNIENIDEIAEFQKKVFDMVPPNLSIVEFREHFLNVKGSPESKMLLFTENPDEKRLLVSYLKRYNVPKTFGDFMAFRFEQLRAMLEDGKSRGQSCQYKISGLVLDHRGRLMLCPIGGHIGSCLERRPSEVYFSAKSKLLRKKLIKTACKSCYPYNFYQNEREKDFLKYVLFFLKSRLAGKNPMVSGEIDSKA